MVPSEQFRIGREGARQLKILGSAETQLRLARHLLSQSTTCEWVRVLHHLHAANTHLNRLAISLINHQVSILTSELKDPATATPQQAMALLIALWDRLPAWQASRGGRSKAGASEHEGR